MLSDGWALQWDDASRGNKFTHWLTKGDARMCLCAKEIGGCRCGAARNEIYLFPVTADEQWTRTEGRRPIKTFCKVAEPDGALVTKRAVDGMSKTKPKPLTSGKSALSAAPPQRPMRREGGNRADRAPGGGFLQNLRQRQAEGQEPAHHPRSPLLCMGPLRNPPAPR